MKKVLFVITAMALLTAGIAVAEEASWLELGGEYQFRYDALKGTVHEYMQYTGGQSFMTFPNPMGAGYPDMNIYTMGVPGYEVKNNSLMTNKFGLHLKAKATEDVTVKAKFDMYKVWGSGDSSAVTSPFFSPEKSGVFDGNTSHVPEDNALRVDYAYATWSNVGGLPAWFSVGRRPSTGGTPSNLKANSEKSGTAGVPSFLIDYAFDGMTVGYAPDIEALPGAFAKVCYGRGYESGYKSINNPTYLKDVDMVGVNVVPYDTTALHVEFQYDKAFNMMSNPPIDAFGPVQSNLGDIEQYGVLLVGKVDNAGGGNALNWFLSGAVSKTSPNDNGYDAPFYDMGGAPQMARFGLLYDGGAAVESKTGSAIFVGARYDITKTRTKIGLEYNQGSKNWIAFAPASDDMIASKVGTRGQVYEIYVIQELNQAPVAKKGSAFFRLGYQLYKFEYTGSNSWLGEPKKISDLTSNPTSMTDVMATQMYAPLEKATDVYLTFNVRF
ncbi:MAG: DUF3373 domain-containing protein [Nitrospirota bacterium]|nr:DUF3373 domain-containing protein [Nitrospirota bacterium]